jgi:peptidyl-prolyl cis-trans isomerase B (cyclophilin B)
MKKMLITLGALILIAIVALAVPMLGQEKVTEEDMSAVCTGPLTGNHYVEIHVKDVGVITAELYADIAPVTVTNFIDLVNQKFYDGLTFHRIISGFMVQGGDPNGNGTGGSGTTIKGEFKANGVENNLKHERGVLSMARSQAYNSASSQFFIMHEDAPHLDGQYAAFGKVLSGIEVVDILCENTPVQDRNGTVAKNDQPVIERIVVIEKHE